MPLLSLPDPSLDVQLRALTERSGARHLDTLRVLAIRGNDRAQWLNGIVSNDVKKLSVGQCLYAAAVAVKGRILTDLFLYVRPDALLLSLPASRVADLLAHFDRYIVMEDVTVEPLPLAVVAVSGPSSREACEGLGERYRTDRLGPEGYDLLVPEDAALPLAAVSEEAWERVRVDRAVPRFEVDFDTTHFIQEAAITSRAVSFQKGCYVGQEMVCRLQMRGHVQKLLAGVHIDGAAAPGDALTHDGAPVGTLTSVAPSLTTPGATAAVAMVKYNVLEKSLPVQVNGHAAQLKAIA